MDAKKTLNIKSLFTKNVKPENHRFFVITQAAYIIGASGHLFAGIIFWLFGIVEMVWFNFLFSVPAFIIAFFLNRKGRHNIAFALGFAELLIHQALGIYYIGWDSGLQYWLIYLVGLSFFNVNWKNNVRIFSFSVVFCTFMMCYLFFKTPETYILSKAQYDGLYLSSSFGVLLLLALLINYYVRTATKAENNLKLANNELSEKNLQIEQTLDERNQALTRLSKELSEAADYVRAILPQPMKDNGIHIDWRFIPSASLGGDAFGYHWLDQDHFAIYLIDVSGHGVGAALLSVSIMNSLRSESLPDTNFRKPEKVLEALNKAFPGEENNDMFFTIWYGVYNKKTREMSFASGGHPPAILMDTSDRKEAEVLKLRTPNFIIGSDSDATYKSEKQIISEKNKLYIFSDGVYEIETANGSMWRFNEFADFLTGPEEETSSNMDRLIKHAKNLSNSEEFEDDVTIMEISFN